MAKSKGHILIIDDNKSICSALEILLQSQYTAVESLSNPNQISSFPKLNEVDLVLLDMNFSAGINSGNEGLYWLKELKKRSPQIAVILMTAYGDIDVAVNGLKEGASDFILKPWENDKLLTTIKSAVLIKHSNAKLHAKTEIGNGQKANVSQPTYSIIGDSEAMKNLLALTHKVAQTDASVLITGENGTGKELIARELHETSARKSNVFVKVDMGAITETLFESELFGHVKGAFTDAKEDRIGKFEAAKGGTLFLDEIGNLSLALQAKLLSAIQNRLIIKVGSNKEIPVDIRLVCATNSNLTKMVKEGSFREDLLYRLNTIHLEVPALKDRQGDVLVLAEFYLKNFAERYRKPPFNIDKSAQEKLLTYAWPGNVRELQHTVERAVILADGESLSAGDFLLQAIDAGETESFALSSLEEMEKLMIVKAIKKHQGNYSAAADQLGISRQTLYNKVKKMQLDV